MRIRVSSSLLGLFLWSAVLVGTIGAQSRQQFRAGVDLVRVDVTVLDSEGRPVHGLSRDDFRLFDDDRQRPIQAFTEIRLTGPMASTWVADVPSDVQSNQAALEGRIVILVVDDATLPSHPRITAEAKRLARDVIEQLGPDDQAAVVFTLDATRSQGLTTDRARLLTAIDGVRPSVGFVRGAEEISNWHFYQSSIEVLGRLADLLAGIPERRKALAFISVGIPVDPEAAASPHAMPMQPTGAGDVVSLGPAEMHRDLLQQMRAVFRRAQRSNVAVYAFDPAGLSGIEDLLIQAGYGADGTHGMSFAAASSKAALGRDFLRVVAENTGGFAVTEGADADRGVHQMFEQTGSYYLLGYRVDPDDRNLTRPLRVEVVNREDLVVKTRTTLGPADTESSEITRDVESALAGALAGVLPASELPMVVNAIPFGTGERDAVVAIVARLHQPAPPRRTLERVELRVSAFDTNGRERASKRQRAELSLLPTDSEAEYEVLTQIRLRPGRYSLRLAGFRTSAGETGSVFYDIDVPDFGKEPLAISGIGLTVSPGVLAAPRDSLEDVLPILPTAQRAFEADERATAFFRVYSAQRRTGAVTLDLQILAEDRAVVAHEARTLNRAAFAELGSVDQLFRLPLEGLSPGTYVFDVRATSGDEVVTRMVRFTVR